MKVININSKKMLKRVFLAVNDTDLVKELDTYKNINGSQFNRKCVAEFGIGMCKR